MESGCRAAKFNFVTTILADPAIPFHPYLFSECLGVGEWGWGRGVDPTLSGGCHRMVGFAMGNV